MGWYTRIQMDRVTATSRLKGVKGTSRVTVCGKSVPEEETVGTKALRQVWRKAKRPADWSKVSKSWKGDPDHAGVRQEATGVSQ